VVSSAMVLAASGSGSLLGHRLKWWHDERWLRAEYRAEEAPARVRVGQDFTVGVTVKNTGTLAWDQLGRQAVRLSYHWEPIGRPATLSDFEGQRTSLPFDVAPGREVRVAGVVRAPGVEGAYRLRWDLVKEGVSWFSACGNAMPVQRVEVTATAGEPLAIAPAEAPPPMADVTPPSRPALWRAAVALFRQRPLLGVGADNFRRRYEAVLSPSAGGQPYTDTRLHANSLYFETLADMGIAGALALAWLARCLLRALRDHAAGGRLAGAACAVGAGTFFVHGALDYFFEFTPLFGLFWVLLGLTAARRPATPTPS
ncbi:MAG TPA: O-antigen ligase family protein, partial [Polyangiaceae bacterium]|nr:O-antigen ligase family protein [Polyangiaceae bacterium]